MAMQTSALLFRGPNDARLASIEMSDPGDDEVQVRTIASFVSTGTERWILSDRFSPKGTPFPCVPGYQRVGVVEKVGGNVKDVRAGQRVIATSGALHGEPVSFWGSHLALGNTHRREIYAVSDRLGDTDASGVVVAQVGYNAASRVAMSAGDWVVIYGDGIIGHCASQAARARGARTILIGRRPERIALAAQYSADHAIDARSGDLLRRVMEITGGRQATAILDTLQREEIQTEYISMLTPGKGQIVYCGHSLDKAWADMPKLQLYGLTCHFISDWTRERIEETIALLEAGDIKLSPLVTHRGTAAEAPGFYRMLLENKEPFLGILIDWSAGQ